MVNLQWNILYINEYFIPVFWRMISRYMCAIDDHEQSSVRKESICFAFIYTVLTILLVVYKTKITKKQEKCLVLFRNVIIHKVFRLNFSKFLGGIVSFLHQNITSHRKKINLKIVIIFSSIRMKKTRNLHAWKYKQK